MYHTPPAEFSIAMDLLGRFNMPIQPALLRSIRYASDAGTLTILLDPKADPVGFVCWASVNKDSVLIAERFNLFPSYPWEYKEGKIAMLLSVFFVYPLNEEARSAFKAFLASHRAIYYIKKNRKRLLIRTSGGFKFAAVH